MENSWGRNVALYGLSGTGATLAACFLDHPDIILTNAPGFAGNTSQQWFIYPDTDIPFGVQSLPRFGLRFPYIYGADVEPNVPL